MKFLARALVIPVLLGCSTTVEMPIIPVTHPAHVDAADAAMPGPPSVFAVDADAVAKPGLPVPDHQAHEEHLQGQKGADDSVHTHVHESNASTARTHPNPQDAPMPGEPGVVFACQIHPDVTAATKGQCPRCGLPLRPTVPPKSMSMAMDEHLEAHMDPLNVGNVPPTVIDEPAVVEADEHPSMKQDMKANQQDMDHSTHEDMQHDMHHGAPSHPGMQPPTLPSAPAAAEQVSMIYACEHHPEIRATFAGATCPTCGMELVAVEGPRE